MNSSADVVGTLTAGTEVPVRLGQLIGALAIDVDEHAIRECRLPRQPA